MDKSSKKPQIHDEIPGAPEDIKEELTDDEPFAYDDADVLIQEKEDRILIDPGEYELRFISELGPKKMFGSWRLILEFCIVSGASQGIALSRFYNIAQLQNGRPVFTPRSHFAKEMKKLFSLQRIDRLSINKSFKDIVVIGRVVTVEKDYEKAALDQQYSKIGELVRIKS